MNDIIKDRIGTMNKYVSEFLLDNGFKKTEHGWYDNDKCSVAYVESGFSKLYSYPIDELERDKMEGYYAISFLDKSDANGVLFMYSKDENIYWLIGVLTYNDLIDRNYKIRTETIE